MSTAVYAGTFDPPTKGHEYVIRSLVKSGAFGRLYVAVGLNPDKKTAFPLETRLDMLRGMVFDIGGDPDYYRIRTFEHSFLVHYAAEIGASTIVRGIRTPEDFVYEYRMRQINRDINPNIETFFIMPPRELAETSSSMVKSLVGPKDWEKEVRRYLPNAVYGRFVKHYKGNGKT
jgi:pantetheine-phosphate adenylyltransferase